MQQMETGTSLTILTDYNFAVLVLYPLKEEMTFRRDTSKQNYSKKQAAKKEC